MGTDKDTKESMKCPWKPGTKLFNHSPLEEYNVLKRLDSFYESKTGLSPRTSKSTLTIWDEFEDLIDENLIDNIQETVNKNIFLVDRIKEKYSQNTFYQQSIVLFIYWMLKKKKQRLLNNWPLSEALIKPLANDLGISTEV